MGGSLVWKVVSSSVKLFNGSQILLYLPLTLSALSPSSFLVLSFFQTVQSIIHCTLKLVLPPQSAPFLPFLQLPVQPVLLLVAFNLASSSTSVVSTLYDIAEAWGQVLRWWTPAFMAMEGIASIVVAQASGRTGRVLAERSENWQFGFLVGAACAYVVSAFWVIWCYSSIATTPLTSTLLGVALTALAFLTLIGFAQRRTNVVESSLLALYFAYSVWLCSDYDGYGDWAQWVSEGTTTYSPLLSNLLAHFSKLFRFITHTVPRPLLFSLAYRLAVLQLASGILPQLGGNAWTPSSADDEENWAEMRPWRRATVVLLAYRQTIFVIVYSHLLLLDQAALVWWRWAGLFFTLGTWAVELLLTADDDDDELVDVSGGVVKGWKVD